MRSSRKHRRNFLPTFVINLVLWVLVGLIIFYLNPDSYLNIVLFFLILTLSLTLTFALLLANTRRGFLLTLFVDSVLILRLFKLANWWNVLLLFLLFAVIELCFSKRQRTS